MFENGNRSCGQWVAAGFIFGCLTLLAGCATVRPAKVATADPMPDFSRYRGVWDSTSDSAMFTRAILGERLELVESDGFIHTLQLAGRQDGFPNFLSSSGDGMEALLYLEDAGENVARLRISNAGHTTTETFDRPTALHSSNYHTAYFNYADGSDSSVDYRARLRALVTETEKNDTYLVGAQKAEFDGTHRAHLTFKGVRGAQFFVVFCPDGGRGAAYRVPLPNGYAMVLAPMKKDVYPAMYTKADGADKYDVTFDVQTREDDPLRALHIEQGVSRKVIVLEFSGPVQMFLQGHATIDGL